MSEIINEKRYIKALNDPDLVLQIHEWFESLNDGDPGSIIVLSPVRMPHYATREQARDIQRRAHFKKIYKNWIKHAPDSRQWLARQRWHELKIITALKYQLTALYERSSSWRLIPGGKETTDMLREVIGNPEATWPAKYDYYNPFRPGGPKSLENLINYYRRVSHYKKLNDSSK